MGHLRVLQWARAGGCPWDESTCIDAARGNHLHVLQWARRSHALTTSENECPWNDEVAEVAFEAGHLDILRWIHYNGLPMDDDLYTVAMECSESASSSKERHDYLLIAEWAREIGLH